MILDKIDDYHTLSSIVHSSSQFHQVYLLSRPKILSRITQRYLESHFCTKVLALSEISPHTNLPSDDHPDFAVLLRDFRQRLMRLMSQRKSEPQQPVLSVGECLAVLRYTHVTAASAVSMRQESSRKLRLAVGGYDYIFIGGVEGMEDCLIKLKWTGELSRWQWKVM